MNRADLYTFYEDLVRTLRDRGVVCGITSGLACVHYGIAETTQDCDLLCHPNSFAELLKILSETPLDGNQCRYRGHISPPLDGRWHRGGWTSHFEWETRPEVTTLDIFGHAVRQSSPWEHDLSGLYAGMNVVAEMKRTDRDKDWPFITSLGTNMLRCRDSRGWLHLFETDSLLEMQEGFAIPPEMVTVRPVLQLAIDHDARLRGALQAERAFWQELDRIRIRLYRAAIRPYVLAVGKAAAVSKASLTEQHALRLACAEQALVENPLATQGVNRLIQDARKAASEFIRPELFQWLPNVHPYFTYLET